MGGLTSKKARLLGGMLGFALLDQLSKWLAQSLLTSQSPVPLIPGVFQLTLAYNTGAAFSMLQERPALLLGITSGIFLLVLAYALRRTPLLRWESLGLALILGGALGNLIDRLRMGRVTDFLDVVAIRYPVFNLADTFIFCGVVLMLLVHLRTRPRSDEAGIQPDERHG